VAGGVNVGAGVNRHVGVGFEPEGGVLGVAIEVKSVGQVKHYVRALDVYRILDLLVYLVIAGIGDDIIERVKTLVGITAGIGGGTRLLGYIDPVISRSGNIRVIHVHVRGAVPGLDAGRGDPGHVAHGTVGAHGSRAARSRVHIAIDVAVADVDDGAVGGD